MCSHRSNFKCKIKKSYKIGESHKNDSQILPHTTDKNKSAFLDRKRSFISKALNIYTLFGQEMTLIEIYNDKIIMIVYKILCTCRLNSLTFLRVKNWK